MNLRIRCQIIKSVFHGKRKFIKDFQIKCKEIRIEILDLFEKGERGHLPSAYSLVEILVTLYFYHSKITPRNYHQSDKILLSKGHGCMALYSILSDLGFIDKKEYLLFCKVGGILGGHPTRNPSIGVEISSGSLGHGASIGLGKALALKLKNILDKNIYVVLGDGECNEGSVWEAALSANKNNLNNLTFIIDYNKLQSYAEVSEVCPLENFKEKWVSFGLETFEADMINDPSQLLEILSMKQIKPRAIICHTIKGQGNKILENNLDWHHKSKISSEDIQLLRENMK